jgi:Uma2 family endonuclease
MSSLLLETGSALSIDDALLMKLSSLNKHLKIERDAEGSLLIMSPSETKTSFFQSEITAELRNWNKVTGRGLVADSQAGFRLPDTSVRSPDAAWVSKERWDALTAEQKEGFAPLCPEFVVEVLSPSDSLPEHFRKMDLWMKQGAQLGLLVDPSKKTYWVYRKDSEFQQMEFSVPFSGEPVLQGFVLDLSAIEY